MGADMNKGIPPALRLAETSHKRAGKGRIELLEAIAGTGSISAAAKAVGLSYKAAWEAVEQMNNLSHEPLVTRTTGGRHGGGTVLTPHGLQVVALFKRLSEAYRQFFAALGSGMEDFSEFVQLIRRLDMKTSARNEFLGRVKTVTRGPVNAEVILDIGGGDELAAMVSNESVDTLDLELGKEAYALVKASWVILAADDDKFKTSARNKLCGVVARCQEGAVNTEVTIELGSGKNVVAIVTQESGHSLGLKAGVRICALIKASHVILAVTA
jgi:molybdate transport system regulatory protein